MMRLILTLVFRDQPCASYSGVGDDVKGNGSTPKRLLYDIYITIDNDESMALISFPLLEMKYNQIPQIM